jgi:hypothetical protein
MLSQRSSTSLMRSSRGSSCSFALITQPHSVRRSGYSPGCCHRHRLSTCPVKVARRAQIRPIVRPAAKRPHSNLAICTPAARAKPCAESERREMHRQPRQVRPPSCEGPLVRPGRLERHNPPGDMTARLTEGAVALRIASARNRCRASTRPARRRPARRRRGMLLKHRPRPRTHRL